MNISHSGDMVVCAVDDRPVGIDIEQIRPIDLTVAKRICSVEELLYLFGHRPTEQDFTYTTDTEILARFFEIWTAKEAYGKCLGSGIGDIKKQVPIHKTLNLHGNCIVSICPMDNKY